MITLDLAQYHVFTVCPQIHRPNMSAGGRLSIGCKVHTQICFRKPSDDECSQTGHTKDKS